VASCVSCHRPIDDAYAFCPLCGEDNRPPERREPITYCSHQFAPGMPCCVLCGATYDEPVGSTPAKRHRATVIWAGIGLAYFAALLYFVLGAYSQTLPGHAWIQSLFEYRYRSYSSSRYSSHSSYYYTSLGNEICWGGVLITIACFSQAFRLDRKLRSVNSGDVSDWAWWQFLWFW
jgi:hypothetical protein